MSAEILLVDDEIGICKSCSMLLTRAGYTVEYVLSADEGIKKYKEGDYHLVITDMKMPGMDGMEFMRQIKARGDIVNIIMITGYATVKSALEAVKIGAFDYIPKPYPPHELTAIVKRAIEDVKLKKSARIAAPAKEAPPVQRPMEGVSSNVAKKIWCINGHSWVRLIDNGRHAEIGVDALYGRAMKGKIGSIKMPAEGDELQQGFTFCQLSTQEPTEKDPTIHSVKSPVSGVVQAANKELIAAPEGLREDYYQSWIVRVQLLNWQEDCKTLTSFDELQAAWMELQVGW